VTALDFERLPLALRQQLAGSTARPILIGESGTSVYRLQAERIPPRYLKIATEDAPRELHIERDKLAWLQGRLPVPQVLFFDEDTHAQYLLISAMEGVDASVLAEESDPLQLVMALAEGLRQIHAVPITECPFPRRLDFMFAEAYKNVEQRLVDEDDFDDERQGFTAEQLYEQLQMIRPRSEDLVFVHGDYCFPNILLQPDTLAITGFIDWSRGGIADRYQDLALVARSIVRNMDERWIAPFYEVYGLEKVDAQKIRFYQLLDEFF
jgi:aminoglycoside phosphotransferase